MKETPILYTTDNVKLILAGLKTKTRRVVKPSVRGCSVGWYSEDGGPLEPVNVQEDGDPWTDIVCPYGGAGDRLWVRETWATAPNFDHMKPSDLPRDICILKKANGVTGGKWRPSIFMPRWASRITLEITEVRVQKLQEIMENDAEAEGLKYHIDEFQPGCSYAVYATEKYKNLWDSINGKKYPWSSNPLVWAITFRDITKELR